MMDDRSPRALVIGAGRGQIRLIEAFKRLGVTTLVASQLRADLPGLALADEVLEVDIRATEEIVAVAREARVDAVATSCMDTGMSSLGAVVEALGLRGVSSTAAQMCNDKVAMKERLVARSVPTAAFRLVESGDELHAALAEIGLPAVVKAADLQGSNGVFIVQTVEDALEAFAQVRSLSHSRQVIVECFLDGVEFGAQAFIHNGEILFILPHEDRLAAGGLPIPVEHSVPMPEVPSHVEEVIADAIRALQLDNCAVNVDLMLVDGHAYILELTGRVGANGLPELMSFALGLDYYELIAREALDLNPLGYWKERTGGVPAVVSWMLHRPELFGTLKSITLPPDAVADGDVSLNLFASPGQELAGFRSSNDCLGQIIVAGNDVHECRDKIAQIDRSLLIELEGA